PAFGGGVEESVRGVVRHVHGRVALRVAGRELVREAAEAAAAERLVLDGLERGSPEERTVARHVVEGGGGQDRSEARREPAAGDRAAPREDERQRDGSRDDQDR